MYYRKLSENDILQKLVKEMKLKFNDEISELLNFYSNLDLESLIFFEEEKKNQLNLFSKNKTFCELRKNNTAEFYFITNLVVLENMKRNKFAQEKKDFLEIAKHRRKIASFKKPKLRDYILLHRVEIEELAKDLTWQEVSCYLKKRYRSQFKNFKLTSDYLRKIIQTAQISDS